MVEARPKLGPFMYVFVGLLTCGIGALVLWVSSRSFVKRLEPSGITLRSGKTFAWSDLKKLQPVYHARMRGMMRVNMTFANGRLSLYCNSYENWQDVLNFIRGVTRQALPDVLPRPAPAG
jgi:hypothetical protein